MKCPTCGAAMRPLLTSMFCPNEAEHLISVPPRHAMTGGISGRLSGTTILYPLGQPDAVNDAMRRGWRLTKVDAAGYLLEWP